MASCNALAPTRNRLCRACTGTYRFPSKLSTWSTRTTSSNYKYDTEMLTADEQYVFIDMVVQYRRTDPVKYSFEVVEPESTLQDVTESALREVVGTTTLEVLIAARRDEIASRTREVLQNTLDSYGAGITVTSISLETVNYPEAVQAAVDDAQKARNDSERYELEADAYARDIIPKARGDAARILEDARGLSAIVSSRTPKVRQRVSKRC